MPGAVDQPRLSTALFRDVVSLQRAFRRSRDENRIVTAGRLQFQRLHINCFAFFFAEGAFAARCIRGDCRAGPAIGEHFFELTPQQRFASDKGNSQRFFFVMNFSQLDAPRAAPVDAIVCAYE